MTIHLRIQLRGINNPPVWRRIVIPGNFTFEELHEAIQADFGWDDEHLYQFQKDPYNQGWAITDTVRNGGGFRQKPIDAAKTKVGPFLREKKLKSFIYLYDFVDDWVHDITVELIDEEAGCSTWFNQGGRGACPPESCGGPFRYEQMKRVLSEQPDSEEAQEYRDWLGLEEDEEFDPDSYVENYIDDICDNIEPGEEEHTGNYIDPDKAKYTTLLECMDWLNLGTLEEYAFNMGFEIDLEKDEDGRRMELATEILNHPKEVLCMLTAYDLAILKQQIEKPTRGHLQEIYEDYCDTIMEVYGLAQKKHSKDGRAFIHLPADLTDAVKPYIDEVIADNDQTIRTTLEIYVNGICNLYGRVSRTTMKQMMVSHKVCDSAEFAGTVLKTLARQSLYIKWITHGDDQYHTAESDDEVFYTSRYEWIIPPELIKEISKHDDVTPHYRQIESFEDIIHAGAMLYPQIPNDYAEKFSEYLKNTLNLTDDEVLEVCHRLWYHAQHQGELETETPGGYMMNVMEILEEKQDKAFETNTYIEAMRQMENYLNNMPRWQLRGHTAAETGVLLSDIGSKTAQVHEALQHHFSPDHDEADYASPYDWQAPTKPFIAPKTPGRNDPCPCGSGKKYKKCCGKGS